MILKTTLKKIMSENDIKVSQLSRAVKIPATTLHNWLSGQHPKNIHQLKRVADYFDISLDFLCFGEDRPRLNPIEERKNEINAGKWEVILRKIKE